MNTIFRKYSFMADKDGNSVMVEVRAISINRAMKEADKLLESKDYHLHLYKIQGEGIQW